jgi:hypothetical protein
MSDTVQESLSGHDSAPLMRLKLSSYPYPMAKAFFWGPHLEQRTRVTMAETTKLSVEKALEKLRGSDPPKSKIARLDEKIDALGEEIKRMRAQRMRLKQQQRTKRD